MEISKWFPSINYLKNYSRQKSLPEMLFAITATLLRIRKRPVKGNDLKMTFLLYFVVLALA